MHTRNSAPLSIRLLSIPVVAIALLAGIWVTGARVTNDFELAIRAFSVNFARAQLQ